MTELEASPREIELSARVANALAITWSHYWQHSDVSLAGDVGAHLARAKALYDLFGEVTYGALQEGMSDLRLGSAAATLADMGDAYAIASIEWPAGIPRGSLPDPFTLAESLVASTIADWCADHGSPLNFAPPVLEGDPGLTSREIEEQAVALGRVGRADFPETLQAGEDSAWEDFERSSAMAAERLREWIALYRRLVAHDRPLEQFNHRSHAELAKEISSLRRAYTYRKRHGARTEAVHSTSMSIAIVRSVFLARAASDHEDLARLHLMPVSAMDRVLECMHLQNWLDEGAP